LDVEGEVVLEEVVLAEEEVVLGAVAVVLGAVVVVQAAVVVDQGADVDHLDTSVVMAQNRIVSAPSRHADLEAINRLVTATMEQLHWFRLPVIMEHFLFAKKDHAKMEVQLLLTRTRSTTHRVLMVNGTRNACAPAKMEQSSEVDVLGDVEAEDHLATNVMMAPSLAVNVPIHHANPEAMHPLVLVTMDPLHWFLLLVTMEISLFAKKDHAKMEVQPILTRTQ